MVQWNNKDKTLVTHVDAFVYIGSLNGHKNVVEKLLCIYKISKKEKGSFRYTELNVKTNK